MLVASCPIRRQEEGIGVSFVADDLGAWLIGLLADACRKKLTTWVLGTEQERALRQAATAAVSLTVRDLDLEGGPEAEELAAVICQVFSVPALAESTRAHATLLEALETGVARQVAALGDASLTGAERSPAEIMGLQVAMVADSLTGHLVREIVVRGSGGGPLMPLAGQFNHDVTHIQGQRLETKVSQLADEVREVLTRGIASEPEISEMTNFGMIRVCEVSPRQLGVHAAIQVTEAIDELPPYIRRDVDAELRAILASNAERGCFVLLVGRSSVGKTRTLYEAIQAEVPDWWLFHPSGAGDVRMFARSVTPRTVVWLDEFQRYLWDADTLTADTVRGLLRSGALVVGTLWPDEYHELTGPRVQGDDHRYTRKRELLDLAYVIGIADEFTAAECDRARELGTVDSRIRLALNTPDAGLTQVLAAGPALVRCWDLAPTPYGQAVISAGIDARRLGVEMPITSELLAEVAAGYLTSAQRATAPGDWLEQALEYAIRPLHGAASALRPVGDGTIGRIVGYVAADYLLQHCIRKLRHRKVPSGTWHTLVDRVQDFGDLERLYHSARARCLFDVAALAERRLIDAGRCSVIEFLALRMYQRGGNDEATSMLRKHINTHDGCPAIGMLLFCLRQRQEGLDEALTLLRARAGAGDQSAARYLAPELVHLGLREELWARFEDGDKHASFHLAVLLAKEGATDEAIIILRGATAVGETPVNRLLAELLVRTGRFEELRERASGGDEGAVERSAKLLAEQGNVEEAIATLRGSVLCSSSRLLAKLLADSNRIEELQVLAEMGIESAAEVLADRLIKQGQLEELRIRAASDGIVARYLACALIKEGATEEAMAIIRAEITAGSHILHASVLNALNGSGREKELNELLRMFDG